MAAPETAKRYTDLSGAALGKFEQLGGELDNQNSKHLERLQASRLTRRYAVSAAAAETLARFVFGEVAR
jgi:hypothetical protein